MGKYRYVLFDLDGTLTDSAEGIINSVIYALRKKGIEETDRAKLQAFVGPPLADSFIKYYGVSPEEARELIAAYREYFVPTGWRENRVYDGIPEALGRLQAQGKHLAVATSKPEPFAKKILEYFGLDRYFELIRGASLDERLSRKEQVIACVLEQFGPDCAREAVMVGDREHDVIGARLNSLPCIGVLYGYGSRRELADAGAVSFCETPADLPAAVG